MSHTMLPGMLALFLILAPFAGAEANDAPRDGEQAWVDDCPPDMMCAFGSDTPTSSDDGPTHGACDEEVCAYYDTPCADEDGAGCEPTPSEGSCMDGTAADCDRDVQYIGGSGGETHKTQTAPPAADTTKTVPAGGLLLAAAGLAGALLLVRRD